MRFNFNSVTTRRKEEEEEERRGRRREERREGDAGNINACNRQGIKSGIGAKTKQQACAVLRPQLLPPRARPTSVW